MASLSYLQPHSWRQGWLENSIHVSCISFARWLLISSARIFTRGIFVLNLVDKYWSHRHHPRFRRWPRHWRKEIREFRLGILAVLNVEFRAIADDDRQSRRLCTSCFTGLHWGPIVRLVSHSSSFSFLLQKGSLHWGWILSHVTFDCVEWPWERILLLLCTLRACCFTILSSILDCITLIPSTYD